MSKFRKDPNNEPVVIYSSDGSGKNIAKNSKKKETFEEIIPQSVCIKLRIEKKGRGGKSVTILYELPNNPPYFKKLGKELKNFCGTGGANKDDTIEIQGEQREKIRAFLEKKGFQVKG